jgi:HlyD family secretion protein
MKKRTVFIVLIIIVLAAGGYFLYNRRELQVSAQGTYQTAILAKGNLTVTVGNTGTVRSNQTTTAAWQIQGRIGKVNVKEGDQVKANQVLAELDPASLTQNIILARSDLVTAQRTLDNLKNSKTSQAQAEQTLADAKKALDDAKTARYGKNLAPVTPETLAKQEAALIIAQDKLKSAQADFNKWAANRASNDTIRARFESQVSQAQKVVDDEQNKLYYLQSRPDPNEVAQAEAAIQVAQSRLNDAQREVDRLKNGADPQDIAAAQARVDSINATLGQTQLVAPIDGTVTDVSSMLGDQVNAGTISFRIEDRTRLLVDLPIAEVDINRVKLSQPASLKFDAIAGKTYNGKVTDVAPFGTTLNGVVNFNVTVQITDADASVRPGMTTSVNLTVEQLNDVLLVPNQAVRLQNSQRIIYLLDNNQPVPVTVTLGPTADSMTLILRGDVKAGDTVILNPPNPATN